MSHWPRMVDNVKVAFSSAIILCWGLWTGCAVASEVCAIVPDELMHHLVEDACGWWRCPEGDEASRVRFVADHVLQMASAGKWETAQDLGIVIELRHADAQ